MGFCLLFRAMAAGDIWQRMYGRTRENFEQAARERYIRSRKKIRLSREEEYPLKGLVQLLDYSGVSLRFPEFTVEVWCLLNVLILAGCLILGLIVGSLWLGLGIFLLCLGVQWLVLEQLRRRICVPSKRNFPKCWIFWGITALRQEKFRVFFSRYPVICRSL